MAACSRALRSSRTLPGHGRDLQERERLGGQNAGRVRDAELAEEVFGQDRDVVHAVAERRQVDRIDVQAEEEVVAEAAVAHLGGEIGVAGRDDADIDRLRLAAADRDDLLPFEHAEQLRLHGQRDVGEFVEEDGAAAREGEQPVARLGRRR